MTLDDCSLCTSTIMSQQLPTALDTIAKMKETFTDMTQGGSPMAFEKYMYYSEILRKISEKRYLGPNAKITIPQDPEDGVPEVPTAQKPLFQ